MNLSELLQRCTVLIRCGEQGTGFFVAPNRVLTCAHVVKKASKVSIEWGGQAYPGSVVQVFSKTYGDKIFPDVALIEVGITGHPCVLLDRDFGPNDDLYAFGFPGLISGGETLLGVCEGFRQYVSGDPDTLLLKFKETQIKHGVSGAAVLNQRTGKVCGMMKTTRDDNTDLGGLAVRIARVFELLPELEEANRKFHAADGAWGNLTGPRDDDWFGPYKIALEQDFGKFTIPARVPLRDVYVEPKIQETSQSPNAGMDKARDQQDKASDAPASRTLGEVMAGTDRKLLAIVGGPGQGKSTLLAHLALGWVEGQAGNVPLMVRLRLYASQRSNFTEFLEKSSYSLPRERTEALLTAGKAMLLLDAFDEVPGDLRSLVVEDIRAAARKYPGAHIILTGRPASYAEMAAVQLEPVGFRRFELADFDDSQVREFLTKWSAWKKSAVEPLIRAIGESASFRRLAGKPLLLMIAASLQKVGNRAELYGEFIKSLLETWDRGRGLVAERADALTRLKISVLEAVALDICEGHEGATATSIPGEKLEDLIQEVLRKGKNAADFETVDKILNGLRDRDSMLEEHDHSFEFVHRTMLEYFCARGYCTRYGVSKSLTELEKLFSDKWHFFWWDEILALIGGSLREKALPLVRKLVEAADGDDAFRATFRAADCLREMEPAAGAEDVRQQIKGQLKKLLRYEFPYVYLPNDPETNLVVEIRAGAADRLTYLSDEETREILMSEVSRNENLWAASRMVPVVVSAWKDERTLEWLRGLIERDGIAAVRIAAAREMARGWKTAEMREWLKASLAGHSDPQVRFAVCWEIAADRKDAESRAAVAKCAREDPDQFVQEEAMRVLVWLWWDAETEDLLFELAQSAKVWYARKAAILMVSSRSKQARVKALCRDRAVNDEHWLLRHAALLAFRNWPDEESMQFVKDRALTDPLPALRGAAAYQLADVWPEAIQDQLFSQRLQAETAMEARIWMVRAVARVLSGSELDEALRPVAEGKENPLIRMTALLEAAQKGTKEVWLPRLRKLAEGDGDAGVRRDCVGMVARIDSGEDVAAWLRERWEKDSDMGVQEAAIRETGRRGGAVATTKDWMLGISQEMMRLPLANMAIYSLTRRWPDRDWLRQQRGLTPLQELARVWTDDETRAYLTKLAVENAGNEGGYESVRLLAWYWPDEQTRELLRAALTDGVTGELSYVAMGAADSIALRCHDEGIWQLLAELARGNGNPRLRVALIGALAFQWREGRTRELLMDLAANDENLVIRQRAIWALGDQWSDEELRGFLAGRAAVENEETRAGIVQILGRW